MNIHNHKRQLALALLVVAMIVGWSALVQATVNPNQFAGIWLEPANQDANKRVGNWGVAQLKGFRKRETHFAFHIHKNFDITNQSYNKAIVVLIPPNDGTLHYTVKRNVARDGDAHTTAPASLTDSFSVTKGELTEVDVSTLLPMDLEPSDYLTMNFELKGYSHRNKTKVVGMRFQYVSTGSGACQARKDLRARQGPMAMMEPKAPLAQKGR